MISEIKQYVDDVGRTITAKIPTAKIPQEANSPQDWTTIFYGNYSVQPHPKMPPIKIEFEFPKGWAIDKCFDHFEEEAKKHFEMVQEDAKKEAMKNKLWTPGAGSNSSGLLVPK